MYNTLWTGNGNIGLPNKENDREHDDDMRNVFAQSRRPNGGATSGEGHVGEGDLLGGVEEFPDGEDIRIAKMGDQFEESLYRVRRKGGKQFPDETLSPTTVKHGATDTSTTPGAAEAVR